MPAVRFVGQRLGQRTMLRLAAPAACVPAISIGNQSDLTLET
jgi:hypothetical protein